MPTNKNTILVGCALLMTLSISPAFAFGEKPKDASADQSATSAGSNATGSDATSQSDSFATFTASIISYLNTELGTKNTLTVLNADGTAMDVPYDLKITGVDKGHTPDPKDPQTSFTLAHFKLV